MSYTPVGIVRLKVISLKPLLEFYQQRIGLHLLSCENNIAYLGVGDTPLLALHEDRSLRRGSRTTGLYHFAIRVPEQYHLARVLKHLAETETPLQGLSDHIVSEAIYLADPEGNGIEIYRDRPREQWYKNGEMQLDTLPLDVRALMASLDGHDPAWQPLPEGTDMGHIHLHVASIPENEQFYREMLGLDVMFNIGSASFLSFEEYHHHIGINIWAGRAAPAPDANGLLDFTLRLPDAEAVDKIAQRLTAAGKPPVEVNGGLQVHDPSGNTIILAS